MSHQYGLRARIRVPSKIASTYAEAVASTSACEAGLHLTRKPIRRNVSLQTGRVVSIAARDKSSSATGCGFRGHDSESKLPTKYRLQTEEGCPRIIEQSRKNERNIERHSETDEAAGAHDDMDSENRESIEAVPKNLNSILHCKNQFKLK